MCRHCSARNFAPCFYETSVETMRKRSHHALVVTAFCFLLCPAISAQDDTNAATGLSQNANISEVMDWLDNNGLAQARIGVKTIPQSAREEMLQDAYPAVSLFYAAGFRLVQGEVCGVILRNDHTTLLDHSSLVHDPAPGQRYAAELYIPLNRLTVKKGKGPYRHTSNSDKAQLLGTWRTEFKSSKSQEDVVLTMFAPGQTEKMQVWKAETLTFTFDNKETSEKFTAAFRQAIKICQPIKFLKR